MLSVQSNYGVSVVTPLLHKKLVFCVLLRHLRAEKGMHSDQDNLILCIMLQETTPVTGALGVYALGSTETPAQFKLLNSSRGAKVSVRK